MATFCGGAANNNGWWSGKLSSLMSRISNRKDSEGYKLF